MNGTRYVNEEAAQRVQHSETAASDQRLAAETWAQAADRVRESERQLDLAQEEHAIRVREEREAWGELEHAAGRAKVLGQYDPGSKSCVGEARRVGGLTR